MPTGSGASRVALRVSLRDGVGNVGPVSTSNYLTVDNTPPDVNIAYLPDNAGIVTPQGIRALSGSLWRSYAMGRAIRLSGVDIFHGLSNELPADIGRTRARSVVRW